MTTARKPAATLKAKPASATGARAKQPGKKPGRARADEAALMTQLREQLAEIADLKAASSVLGWDTAVNMPSSGASARSRQTSRLASLAHARATDAALGRLLDTLEPYAAKLDAYSDDARLIRVARRDFERETRVPADFVARDSAHGTASYQAWIAARPANDFKSMIPYLEVSLRHSQEYAEFFPGYAHVMDPLIGPEEGLGADEVDRLFSALKAELLPLLKSIVASQPTDDSCLRQSFPAAQQMAFAREVATDFGYGGERGRIDLSPHPFCTRFSRDDVRITTRIRDDDLGDCLFSVLHEAGHALYEQGIAPALEATTLSHGASTGVHESQSRLWENIVGRSRPFWQHYYPRLQKVFPDQLGRVPLDTFYRAINKVDRTLIRTDSDEVTYNLHIMLRFELEKAMLEGKLAPRDLREAWNEAYRASLGIVPPDDKDGVLQDVHWYGGGIGGYFQGYTIGNILAAQIWEAALAAKPQIADEIAAGQFATLRDWLEATLHKHGRKFTAPELIPMVTGAPLSIGPYMRYLKGKYGALYGV